MAEVVRMPKLSDTMTEGVVVEWHKKVGDKVESGDLLAEIETDKATMEFESFQEGVLLYIGVKKGQTAAVDAILAILGKKGEKIDKILKEEKKNGIPKPVEKEIVDSVVPQPPTAEPVATLAPQPTPGPASSSGDRVKASPMAKKLANEKGVNISFINGTGDGGRVTKKDIESYLHSAAGGTSSISEEKFTEVGLSQMRKTIATRLAESKFTAPHFYLTVHIDMDRCIDARTSINATSNVKISFNDIVIKAAAAALRKHPAINSSWLGDRIRYNEHINIGVAIAVEDGLLVPVVRYADGKTLTQINIEVKDFAVKAREKKLQPEDWEGNTFTVSNLGMFGVDQFTAIINTPDACIMAISGIRETPIVKNGAVVPGNLMAVTLSCDHRVVDGVSGAEFLQTFKHMMENPVLFLGASSI
ncbi:MAG TPA: 2-oxo acid dehydrogenase subunit E2 [Flavobacteriales bacterium]|nr:2-oxo acid dehydrogenase subunit E2 [Flavobacteriales bacterium]HIA10750.1 2-oxo acid dehydrogenase subunit E2 [Flavobacteriales bacterium]